MSSEGQRVPDSEKPKDLVVHFPNYVDEQFISGNNLRSDMTNCYEGLHWNAKYVWLSDAPTTSTYVQIW